MPIDLKRREVTFRLIALFAAQIPSNEKSTLLLFWVSIISLAAFIMAS